ncbi:MAG: hypothetical protein D6797_07570 [Bdellovibrio sp.]|nr:MAG: hypothetical protein D6797_07570 [Bdellovibrio sp.]
MDFKSIKGIVQKSIKQPLPVWDPAQSIEKALKAFESFWAKKYKTSIDWGLECEKIVAFHFIGQGYQFMGHRIKTPYGEVDLIFVSPQKDLVFVEVKSIGTEKDFSNFVLRQSQRQRLKNVLAYYFEQGLCCRLHLSLVNRLKKVFVFKDILAL